MATLSVILCNYNHGATVARAIIAIAMQSRSPDQFIVVDDDSTDESLRVIEPLLKRFPFIEFRKNVENK